MSMTTELAKTKELAFLMTGRFSMNPISCKILNEAWREAFPDEVAVAKRMLALVEELEAAEKRIAELEASHSTLRETLAAIHNTIKLDGFTTPLAVIMRNAQCAYEESAAAAGVAVEGE